MNFHALTSSDVKAISWSKWIQLAFKGTEEPACQLSSVITVHLVFIGERSERDTIRGVQIRAGEVRIYIYIFITHPSPLLRRD